MSSIFEIAKKTMRTILIVLVTIINAKAQSSINGPGTDGSGINANGTPNNSPAVPFDGGMSIVLLVSGVVYATKKQKWKPINNS
jgi:hypothetical protein